MIFPKFLLPVLVIFSIQGFATPTSPCIDLSGEYQCTWPESTDTVVTLSITQSVNTDSIPLMNLGITTPGDPQTTFKYIADGKIHTHYAALCKKDFFRIILPANNNYLKITTHYLTSSNDMNIDTHLATMHINKESNTHHLQIIQKLDSLRCTKIQ